MKTSSFIEGANSATPNQQAQSIARSAMRAGSWILGLSGLGESADHLMGFNKSFFPHLCVGFLFLILYPAPPPPPPPPTHLCHTQLCHTHLCHTHLCHTQLCHTQLWRGTCDIHLHFAWQVWHLLTSTSFLGGRRRPWRHPPVLCAAGVALMAHGLGLVARLWPVIVAPGAARHCAWQGWHPISTCTLGGRRGTW